MDRRVAILAILCLALLLAAGCAGTTGHLAMATTRDVDPRAIDLDAVPGRHVVGRSCVHVIVAFPVGMPNLGDAIDDALSKAGGQVLSHVVVGYEFLDIPFVYGVACYVAEGDAR